MTINDQWDIDHIRYMIRSLERQVAAQESRLEVLEDTVADHGSQLDGLPRDAAEKSDIEGLESRIDDLENRIDDIGD